MESKYTLIGIMTGTSLDGIDLSIVDFYKNNSGFRYEEKFFRTYTYPERLKEKIYKIISTNITIYEVSQLSFAISEVFAICVNNALDEAGINSPEILSIGVHGQTLWHQPNTSNFAGMKVSSTLQLCNLSALKEMTNIPVIGDFRAADIANGGQGAPLVPIFDYHFLKDINKNIFALNIGGISNITYLPKNADISSIIGFDTGPGNVMIDSAAKKFFNLNYDENGSIARSGNLLKEKLDELMQIEYINQNYPKSTGRELFNVMLFNKYFENEITGEDVICTLTHFTAKSIAENIKNSGLNADKIIVSGGGAYNGFLMELISEYSNTTVISTEALGIKSDSKEAVCFAFLALLHILNIEGNIPTVTGAKKSVVLGVSTGLKYHF